MIIESYLKQYKVNLEENFNFFINIKKEHNKLFVIDKNVYNIYRDKLFYDLNEEDIYLLDAIEENKNIETALDICDMFMKLSAKKNALLISIGGGIVQDITGFVANILYRGIRWIFIPTTLLSSCDSCIGSKTSLNYKKYKNILGTFYPPDSIYICPEFFLTLSSLDFNSGLGEVIKFNIMSGESGINNIENNIDALEQKNITILNIFINNSLKFKKNFIEKDEFDKAERVYLNFAHTFGHSIEVVSNYKVPHGIAVVLGMIMANRISVERNLLKESSAIRIEKLCYKILKHINIDKIWLNVEEIIEAIKKDKKQISDNLTAILLCENFEMIIANDLKILEVKNACDYLRKYIYNISKNK